MLLQTAEGHYYNLRQVLLQIATGITNCESTNAVSNKHIKWCVVKLSLPGSIHFL